MEILHFVGYVIIGALRLLLGLGLAVLLIVFLAHLAEVCWFRSPERLLSFVRKTPKVFLVIWKAIVICFAVIWGLMILYLLGGGPQL